MPNVFTIGFNYFLYIVRCCVIQGYTPYLDLTFLIKKVANF